MNDGSGPARSRTRTAATAATATTIQIAILFSIGSTSLTRLHRSPRGRTRVRHAVDVSLSAYAQRRQITGGAEVGVRGRVVHLSLAGHAAQNDVAQGDPRLKDCDPLARDAHRERHFVAALINEATQDRSRDVADVGALPRTHDFGED